MLSSKEYENCSHLGQLFLTCIRKKPKDAFFQIDAADGTEESYGSVYSRSVRLTRALTRAGLAPGDVLALGGPNHIHLAIPYYAALMSGLPVAAVDPYFKYDEIKTYFNITKPKIAFCQQDMREVYEKAAKDVGISDLKVVTFDGEYNMERFIKRYDEVGANDDEYQPVSFDAKTLAWLVPTSGTTGFPKVATFSHEMCVKKYIQIIELSMGGDGKSYFTYAPVQWVSSYFYALATLLMDYVKLQTSKSDDVDHMIDVINKYKPDAMFGSPAMPALILKSEKPCDWTCFSIITLTGSKIHKEMILQLKSLMRPDAILMEAYGQVECFGAVLLPNPSGPVGSCGLPLPMVELKLVDPETGKDVSEPRVVGEAWVKGEFFLGYYNNPEETAKIYSSDGWLKTGDLLYRDEEFNYFFVDRLKMLIKYRNFHIAPPEVEGVICRHPGVLEAGVAGVPHREDGQHAAALVILKPGVAVTENEIDQLVAETLSDSKRLRGGVFFVDSLPKTSSGKVAREKLKQEVFRLYNLRTNNKILQSSL